MTNNDTPRVLGLKATIGVGRDRVLVGYLPHDGWWCDCPARRHDCAHLDAVRALLDNDAHPPRVDVDLQGLKKDPGVCNFCNTHGGPRE